MRLARGVYEGPGSHGILRIAASIKGVHTVLRALPGENYFPALLASRTASAVSDPAPVSLSPIWARPPVSRTPGDLERDLANAMGREGVEAVMLARTEAALLSGEQIPAVEPPADPKTGKARKLITCPWESTGTRELEAADLALEALVRAYARPQPRAPEPTVNLFGPPLFSPNAAAETAEVERLLGLIGVKVNVRVPLGSSTVDLERLGRAWANVLLYRETGESTTRYLHEALDMPRITTPAIGSAGTGALLRTVGDLCSVETQKVERAVWTEISQTARLPWYARLVRPETFRNLRIAIFGDYTYTLGLGYTLAREVGGEVVACGTYLRNLEKDFLFHANTFTSNAFISDDPDEAASRIEASKPNLLIGTSFEKEVAETLGVPFLPLCPPLYSRVFVEKPLMGYTGTSVLADTLGEALGRADNRESGRTSPKLP